MSLHIGSRFVSRRRERDVDNQLKARDSSFELYMFMSRNEFKFLGGHSSEVPPDPIPNSEVKLASADGTAGVILWESRSPPRFSLRNGEVLQTTSPFCVFVVLRFRNWAVVGKAELGRIFGSF